VVFVCFVVVVVVKNQRMKLRDGVKFCLYSQIGVFLVSRKGGGDRWSFYCDW